MILEKRLRKCSIRRVDPMDRKNRDFFFLKKFRFFASNRLINRFYGRKLKKKISNFSSFLEVKNEPPSGFFCKSKFTYQKYQKFS